LQLNWRKKDLGLSENPLFIVAIPKTKKLKMSCKGKER
jgi:hypothetical protein